MYIAYETCSFILTFNTLLYRNVHVKGLIVYFV